MMNCSPMSLSVFVIITPHSKDTTRVAPSLLTVAFVCSVAVMFSFGFIASPVNST